MTTLPAIMGERFTPDPRDAWRETYVLVAAVMRRGARPSEARTCAEA